MDKVIRRHHHQKKIFSFSFSTPDSMGRWGLDKAPSASPYPRSTSRPFKYIAHYFLIHYLLRLLVSRSSVPSVVCVCEVEIRFACSKPLPYLLIFFPKIELQPEMMILLTQHSRKALASAGDVKFNPHVSSVTGSFQ